MIRIQQSGAQLISIFSGTLSTFFFVKLSQGSRQKVIFCSGTATQIKKKCGHQVEGGHIFRGCFLELQISSHFLVACAPPPLTYSMRNFDKAKIKKKLFHICRINSQQQLLQTNLKYSTVYPQCNRRRLHVQLQVYRQAEGVCFVTVTEQKTLNWKKKDCGKVVFIFYP